MKKIVICVLIVFIAMSIYLLFTNLFIFPSKTEGMSMFPTIAPNEIRLSNRWKIITKQELKRGDIIVFEEPSSLYVSKEEFDENNLLAKYDNVFYINPFRTRIIKRIIGLPGDHIQITENNELYLNGEIVGYANKEDIIGEYMYIDLIVPDNSVYVMGDNRKESIDSRSFGCIPITQIFSVLF